MKLCRSSCKTMTPVDLNTHSRGMREVTQAGSGWKSVDSRACLLANLIPYNSPSPSSAPLINVIET